MKTLYISRSGKVGVDTETNRAFDCFADRSSVDNVYLIDNDCNVVINAGTYNKELDAKAGDILVTFYSDDFPNRCIIVNSKEWAENIKAYRDAELKRKEEWAKNMSKDEDAICGDPKF